VAHLQYGPLQISFGQHPGRGNTQTASPGPTLPENGSPNILDEQATEQHAALTKDEVTLREEQIAELWLTDPARAEEMLMRGEFEPPGVLEDGET
jgi:hypothetical protein